MQEYKQDKCGAEIFHAWEIDVEELAAHGAVVGIFVAYNLFWQIPAHKETGEESADRKKNLSGEVVENVEQRLSADADGIPVAQRQGA